MPSTRKSPFATSFKSFIKKGVPCGQAVSQIAKRSNKNPNTVFQSLWSAGLVNKTKVNGQWVFWAATPVKSSTKNAKVSQGQLWQNFIDWCFVTGNCTPAQIKKYCKNPSQFFAFATKLMNKQFTSAKATSKSWPSPTTMGFNNTPSVKSSSKSTSSKSSKTAPKSKAKKSRRTTKSRRFSTSTWSRTFSFPTTSTRRWKYAA